ncbi:MAG TPA: hypothetical protein VJT15_04975 [Pyrinomonadaceae bacterium]|nr:hypothetical protein [Pyrinomonadaceae bacterium]
MKISHILTSLILLSLLTLFPVNSSAQTVLNRSKIGGYAEDITFVTKGALKDKLVMTNGYELYSASLDKSELTRVCKVDHPEFDQFVNGFTFVESENLFVMNNAPQPNKLFFVDQNCTPKTTRTIQYLNSSYRPAHVEGLAYIPESSPVFPDHLIMVAWDTSNATALRLIIMRRDGVQVADISRPDWPPQFFEGGLGDVTFLAPNRLLVSLLHRESLWTMDFDGEIQSGPLATDASGLGEGIVRLENGTVVASSYPQSLLIFDKNLNRQPAKDHHNVIGLNLNTPMGIAWDSDFNRFLVTHDTFVPTGLAGIAGLSATLDNRAPALDLASFPSARQTVYLPQEDVVAVLNSVPRLILLFNLDGTLSSLINLSQASLGQNLGTPLALAYLRGSNELVVGFGGIGANQTLERRSLRVFSRSGTLVRTIDLSATGIASIDAIEYFDDPNGQGGRLLVVARNGRAIITDLNGNSRDANGALFGEFNIRVKLGLITANDIAAITSGPLAGAFAIADGYGGEVVIFRLN